MKSAIAIMALVASITSAVLATSDTTASAAAPRHFEFDRDTTFTTTFMLRPGDSVELRNGACLCFGPGGSADWQGTPTSTWSNDGGTQNLERDIEITGNGHIRFENGSVASTIRYVEIDLQPDLLLAEYPLHWHHVRDGSRGTLVEGVVVKNSTNRGFVPHGSYGITFRDTIAKNVTSSGYWWDPPESATHTTNQSRDILYDHVLVDGVIPPPDDPLHGRELSGITVGAGPGNVLRDSVAMNVHGSDKVGGCITWPSRHQNTVWTVSNITAHHCTTGLWVWQNTSDVHLIDGVRTWNNQIDLLQGAYSNPYLYRNVQFDSVEAHALGWSIVGGAIGTVTTQRHIVETKPIAFTNVTVERLILDNDRANSVAGHYIFTDTGLTFNDVKVESVMPGTRVTIDGETRRFGFSDVRRPHVFADDIDWLAGEGITHGCNPPANTRYCPEASVTRGQMAAFLSRALKLPAAKKDWFTDDSDSEFEDVINRLADAGISKGCNPPANSRYCPDSRVSRAQMAAFLVRAVGYSDNGGGDLFIDDDGSVFEDDIDRLGTAGVTRGCNPPTNNRFCPKDSVTRGQMAAFLHRAFG